jgi:hypothetical protein
MWMKSVRARLVLCAKRIPYLIEKYRNSRSAVPWRAALAGGVGVIATRDVRASFSPQVLLLPSSERCCKSRFARWQMTRRRQVRKVSPQEQ